MTGVLMRQRSEKFETQEKRRWRQRLEVAATNQKNIRVPSAAGRGKEGYSPRAFRGNVALPKPSF